MDRIEAAARALARLRVLFNARNDAEKRDEAFIARAVEHAWRNWVNEATAALAAADAAVSEYLADDYGDEAKQLATMILVNLGFGVDASQEPWADRRRHRLCRMIEPFLARRGAGVVPAGWRPIETAPKDGTEFLAYDSHAKKQDVCNWVQFGAQRGEVWATQSDSEYGPGKDEFGYLPQHITHWMPLPEPPTD